MASAPSISACKLVKGDWSSGMYECSVLSCAWKTPRALTGALATTSNCYEARRSRRRASSNFINIMNAWRCENNNLEKPNDSKYFNFALSRRHIRSHHALGSNKKWKLFCTSFLESFDEISPDSLWEDLKPAISYLAPKELILVNDALKLAFKAHNGQKRRSGEPFIIHPVEVARILGELELDWESIAVGLLHDTVEDTSVTFETIEKEFGSTVRHIVLQHYNSY